MRYGYIRKNRYEQSKRLHAIDMIHDNDVLIENIFIESGDSNKSFRKAKTRLHTGDVLVISNICDLSDTFEEQLEMIQEIIKRHASLYLCDCDVFLTPDNNVIKLLEMLSSSST